MADAAAWKPDPGIDPMVGHDGTPAAGTLSLADPRTSVYLAERYAILARSGPSFVWVDDDARVQQHPPAYWPDFSGRSLDEFARRHGVRFTREELLSAFDDPDDGGVWRARWTEHLSDLLAGILHAIGSSVRRVDPSIELGLMSSGIRFNSYGRADLAGMLSALGASRARPGGGFYTDRHPWELFLKAADCGEQAAAMRGFVRTLDYEFETFPQQRDLKSVRMARTECSLMIACGMDGVTAHILKPERGDLSDYGDWIDALSGDTALWDEMTARAASWPVRGFRAVSSPLWFERRPAARGHWIPSLGDETRLVARTGWHDQAALLPLGIPIAFDDAAACGSILTGSTVHGFTRAQLETMLKGAVLMDAAALDHLSSVGLGDAIGVTLGEAYTSGVLERATAHPVNGDDAGEERDVRLGVFGREHAVAMHPVPGAGVDIVAELVSYDRAVLGAAIAVGRSAYGGRVAVLGYAPWSGLESGPKRRQLKALLAHLLQAPLPVSVEHRSVVPTLRQDDGRGAFLLHLLNPSLDPADEFEVIVRSTADSFVELTREGTVAVADERVHREDDLVRIRIAGIEPWGFRVIAGEAA
jgi:hypothetical protein